MELGSYFMPHRIIGLDHGVPVFSLRDINLYGPASLYGVSFDEEASPTNEKLLHLLAQRLADG